MIAKGICPGCHTNLEPAGNISYDRHAYGYITKGKVRCPDCGWKGTLSLDICVIFKEAEHDQN